MMNEQKLREYFDFNEDDLIANRKGRLSEKQLKHLDAERKHKPGIEWGIGLLLFIFAGAGIYGAVMALFQDASLFGRIVFVLIFGVIWPYLFGKLGLQMIDSTRPKRNSRVKVERGHLQFRNRNARDIIPYYELQVGDRTIEVADDLSAMVVEGDRYAMYFLAKTRGILSVEHISKEK
jgi:hypothetical protein